MTRRQSLASILNWDGMRFPVHLGGIDYFEEISNGKVSTNVYEISEHLGQNYIIIENGKTNRHAAKYHIDLVRIEEDDENHDAW